MSGAKSDQGVQGYRVLIGVNYPENQRAEVGDIVYDLPAYAIKQLLASGVIKESE